MGSFTIDQSRGFGAAEIPILHVIGYKIMINPLQEMRLHYRPPLPQLLQKLTSLGVIEGDQKSSPMAIKDLLPHTAQQPLLHFQMESSKKFSPQRVGVVLSGGQAPGGHNVIVGLFDALKKMDPDSQLFGFLNGPAGILNHQYQELTAEGLASYRNSGGFDLLGSGRTKIEAPDQFHAAFEACRKMKLNGLVIIGGDDSNTNAALIAEYLLTQGSSTKVVGVPKTIDGDLKNEFIETSFGFDTACKIYSELIGNLCRDALSAKKYTHFVKLMGRSASHIALECALQTHPNITLIGEEIAEKKMTLSQIVDSLCLLITQRSQAHKHYGVILIPEGLIEFIPEMNLLFQELNRLLADGRNDPENHLSRESAKTFACLPKEIGHQLLMDRDPHGNVQVSHIATEQILKELVQEKLKNWPDFQGKFHPITHFFGYEGRCGYPSNFDANYCYALGHVAALLITSGKTGYMSVLKNLAKPVGEWLPLGVPLADMMDFEERKGKKKPVIKKALVDLKGKPFKFFSHHRSAWMMEDLYRFPGPIQWGGPSSVSDATTLTMQFDQDILDHV